MTPNTQDVLISIASASSMIGCLVLLGNFYHMNKKPTSLKMIVILTISDLLVSTSVLIWTFDIGIMAKDSPMFLVVCLAGFLYFSIVWSCNIACFVYKSINGNTPSDPKQYLKRSSVICIALAVVTDIVTYMLSRDREDHLNLGIGSLIILLILFFVVLMTTYYYFKAIKVLNQYPIEFQKSVQPAIKNLHFYAFAQLVTIGPYLLLGVIRYKSQVRDNWFVLVGVIANLSGLVNVLIYLFTSGCCYIEFNDKDVMAASLIE